MKNECKGCQDRDRMITLLAERIDELAKEIGELRRPEWPNHRDSCGCLLHPTGEILEWSDKCKASLYAKVDNEIPIL